MKLSKYVLWEIRKKAREKSNMEIKITKQKDIDRSKISRRQRKLLSSFNSFVGSAKAACAKYDEPTIDTSYKAPYVTPMTDDLDGLASKFNMDGQQLREFYASALDQLSHDENFQSILGDLIFYAKLSMTDPTPNYDKTMARIANRNIDIDRMNEKKLAERQQRYQHLLKQKKIEANKAKHRYFKILDYGARNGPYTSQFTIDTVIYHHVIECLYDIFGVSEYYELGDFPEFLELYEPYRLKMEHIYTIFLSIRDNIIEPNR